MELSDRKLKILSAVIDNYVKSGEPISSKIICNLLDSPVSSATIRNELAELTELGFLEQPHTSAGRVPSHLGYRLYINKLMRKTALSPKTKRIIDSALNSHIVNPEQLLKEASHLLANITNFAVISTDISSQKNFIKRIHLVQVGSCSAMMILTTSSGIIKNQLFRCKFLLSNEMMNVLNKVLNDNFLGVSLDDINPSTIKTISDSLGNLAFFMSDVFSALLEISEQSSKTDIHFDGQINLLLIPEFNPQSVVKVVDFFNCSDGIRYLYTCEDKNKTRVLIGQENKHEVLSKSSIIITRYNINNGNHGSIGIIGPTRMNYSKLIADLEYIASSIEEILNNLLNLE